ncbi:759_t:CDS:2, partial [Scutellospora calospora]
MDTGTLPPEYYSKLEKLKKELDDEDITEKGFEKKKKALLENYKYYIPVDNNISSISSAPTLNLPPFDYDKRTSPDNSNIPQKFYASNGESNPLQNFGSDNNNPQLNLYLDDENPYFRNQHRNSTQTRIPPHVKVSPSHNRTHSENDAIDSFKWRPPIVSRATDPSQSNVNFLTTPPVPASLDPNPSQWGSRSLPPTPGYMPVQQGYNPSFPYHSSPAGYGSGVSRPMMVRPRPPLPLPPYPMPYPNGMYSSVHRPIPGPNVRPQPPRPVQYIRPLFNDNPTVGRTQQIINDELDVSAEATKVQDDNESIRSSTSYAFKLDGLINPSIPSIERFTKSDDKIGI